MLLLDISGLDLSIITGQWRPGKKFRLITDDYLYVVSVPLTCLLCLDRRDMWCLRECSSCWSASDNRPHPSATDEGRRGGG